MQFVEMFQRVLVESGQFLISPTKIELKEDNFALLVNVCLGIYNQHVPIDRWFNINVATTRQFEFTETSTDIRGHLTGIPEKIVDYIPIRISGVYPFYLREYDRPKSNLDIKTEMPAVYRKPVFTVPIQGEWDIQATYRHKVTQIPNVEDGKFEVVSIDDTDSEFLELLCGKFMQALGRNRRAFTLSPLPLVSDASDMVSEGRDKEEKALEAIFENKKKWYLAWG